MDAEGKPRVPGEDSSRIYSSLVASCHLYVANAVLGDADLDAFLGLGALVTTLCKGLVNRGIDTSSNAVRPDACEPVGIVMLHLSNPRERLCFNQGSTVMWPGAAAKE